MKHIQKLRSQKFFAVLLAIMLLSLSCGGGPKSNKEQVTLKIWKPFVDSGKMQAIFTEYQKVHPNVQIEYVKKNIENYEGDLLNSLAAGEGPDIFSINNTWLPRYLDKTTPAPDSVFTYKDYHETFVDVISQDFTKDNKIYGTALWVDSLALYYNKDILGTVGIATPPRTWLELAEDVRTISRQDATGYFTRSGVAMGTNSNVNRAVDIVYLLMLQAGAVPWSADGRLPQFGNSISRRGATVNPGQDALGFYTSFATPSNVNYTWNERSDYSIDAFANGRAGYLYSYAYAKSLIDSKSPNLNYDIAPVPQYNLDDSSVNFANYFGEVVNKQSKHADWAWDFLKFATSRDTLDKYYAQDKQPSSRRDLIELQTSDPIIGVFAHANLTAKSFYNPDQAKQDGIFETMINNIILKGMRVSEALQQAQSQASTLTQVRN
jgi:multiple sugar transport system substrate-binding protein